MLKVPKKKPGRRYSSSSFSSSSSSHLSTPQTDSSSREINVHVSETFKDKLPTLLSILGETERVVTLLRNRLDQENEPKDCGRITGLHSALSIVSSIVQSYLTKDMTSRHARTRFQKADWEELLEQMIQPQPLSEIVENLVKLPKLQIHLQHRNFSDDERFQFSPMVVALLHAGKLDYAAFSTATKSLFGIPLLLNWNELWDSIKQRVDASGLGFHDDCKDGAFWLKFINPSVELFSSSPESITIPSQVGDTKDMLSGQETRVGSQSVHDGDERETMVEDKVQENNEAPDDDGNKRDGGGSGGENKRDGGGADGEKKCDGGGADGEKKCDGGGADDGGNDCDDDDDDDCDECDDCEEYDDCEHSDDADEREEIDAFDDADHTDDCEGSGVC